MDSNALSDLIESHPQVVKQFRLHLQRADQIILCPPVYFEVERGLLWGKLTRKYGIFRDTIAPRLERVGLIQADWEQAVQYYVDTRSKGRQLSDLDLLIAAIAHRLDAIIVSSDADFDALPIKRENWR